MSVISTIHTAVVYEPKGPNKTTAQFNQRLVRTIAKADKDGNYGQHLQQTMATSIPQLTASDVDFTDARLQGHLVAFLCEAQNKIIGEALRAGIKTVTTEQLNQLSIVQYLEAESAGEKWDEARIASWFNDNIAEAMGVKMIENGVSDSALEKNLTGFCKKFAETLSSKAQFGVQRAKLLQKAMVFAPTGDPISARFQTRISKVLDEKSEEESYGV